MRSITLWIIGLLALFLLTGCATKPPEPAETADDTEVIEESIVTVDPEALKCPRGTTEWCVRKFRHEKCRCVKASEGRDVMETWPNPDYRRPR
ncbi:MAG: hypothetical protein HKO55_08005 [Gammaproteobacteria bacterium]|nr:hypothetical protein [Gammaproteobacteria bacterium]